MRKADIQGKIDVVLDNLEKLHSLRSKPYEDFISDFRNTDSALHRMQTSIQALLDIGSYVIASLGLATPDSNAGIIEILAEAGLIPKEKTVVYIKMSRFRNRIVHLYNHIDTEMLYNILLRETDDIKGFFLTLLEVIGCSSS
jgi:uncharacterized protein YutE (UPF0331/DUF86 family)